MFIDLTCECGAVAVVRVRDQGQLRRCHQCGAQLVVPPRKNLPFYKMLERDPPEDSDDTDEHEGFA